MHTLAEMQITPGTYTSQKHFASINLATHGASGLPTPLLNRTIAHRNELIFSLARMPWSKHCNTEKEGIGAPDYSLLKRRMLLTRRLRLSARSKLMLPRLKPGCATVKPGVLVRMNLPPTDTTPREILKCSILALRAGESRVADAQRGKGGAKEQHD